MLRRCALLVLVLFPTQSMGQDAEDLLSKNTQLYVRWDGGAAHRDAFNKTAMGKIMAGDMGKFVDSVFEQLTQAADILIAQDLLLEGIPPEKLQKLQKDVKKAIQILSTINEHGFVLAADVE